MSSSKEIKPVIFESIASNASLKVKFCYECNFFFRFSETNSTSNIIFKSSLIILFVSELKLSGPTISEFEGGLLSSCKAYYGSLGINISENWEKLNNFNIYKYII